MGERPGGDGGAGHPAVALGTPTPVRVLKAKPSLWRFAHVVPYALRVELKRLRTLPSWLLEARAVASERVPPARRHAFTAVLTSYSSPLERVPGAVPPRLQSGKERNVAVAASRLDGVVVHPGQEFSYHHAVGRPSRLRGFRPGLELHGGAASRGVGGGCCQVSNALYLLALRSGMKIVERHRHGLDLFPDHGRTVPFGCGATVFYNYVDLRFENPLPHPVLITMAVEHKELVCEVRTTADPGWSTEIYEVDHRFYVDDAGCRIRENRIRRRFTDATGIELLDQEVAHNIGRVMYEVPDAETCCGP